MRSGGDSRFAGFMLAVATFGILMIGPIIIAYIPVMVVGTLIFYLGFDLIREALVDTIGRVHRLEYLTVRVLLYDIREVAKPTDCYHCSDDGHLRFRCRYFGRHCACVCEFRPTGFSDICYSKYYTW